jgi:muconate cycloisomerase
MRIAAIDLYHLAVPLAVPYKLSKVYGTVRAAEAVIARVATDRGLVGYGEADPDPRFTGETPAGVMAAIHDRLGPRLLGEDSRHLNRLLATCDEVLSGNPSAKGAIDMALHDLAGKAYGLPVHALLGGPMTDRLPVLWPLGSGTVDDDAAILDAKIAEGYGTFMVKLGADPLDADLARSRALVDRYGDAVTLTFDANQGWTEAEAVTFVTGMREHRSAMIEQPLAAWDIDGLRRLRDLATSPLSADESVVSIRDALALVARRAVDIFSLKVSKNGGIAATGKIASVAEAAGTRCLMNSMLEFGISQAASLHLGVTLRNLVPFGHAYMSTLRLADDVTDFGARVRDGYVSIDDRPGLGIAVDEAKLKKYLKAHVRLGDASRAEVA